MYAFCVVIVYSMRSCVLFNLLLVYCLLFVYFVVYVTYTVLTLPPCGQPICNSVIIIIICADMNYLQCDGSEWESTFRKYILLTS
jgi:hypothetical protein